MRPGTIVKLLDVDGNDTAVKAIVVGTTSSTFSREFGELTFVCSYRKRNRARSRARTPEVFPKRPQDMKPIGAVRRVPSACVEALRQFRNDYPALAGNNADSDSV